MHLDTSSSRPKRRRRRAVAGAILFVGALLAGCSPVTPGSPDPSGPPDPTAGPSQAPVQPPDGTWNLVELGDIAIDAIAIPTIAFAADGTISGSTGCNQYSGPVTLGDGTIAVGPLAATKRGCEDFVMRLEDGFVTALAGARQWTVAGGQLIVDGTTRLVFEPAG